MKDKLRNKAAYYHCGLTTVDGGYEKLAKIVLAHSRQSILLQRRDLLENDGEEQKKTNREAQNNK